MKEKLFCVIILLATLFVNVSYSQEPLFKDGDRVCFIGSSIAMNGANMHYVNLSYATRYPDRKVSFINCGISGDVTDEILRRMESDILINHPTWAVLMLEENDLKPSLYYKERLNEPGIMEKRQKALGNWFKNADSIVQILLKANVKVILETPTIYDQTANLPAKNAYGLNDSLKKCMIYLKRVADKYKLPLVDCWTILYNVNKRIQRKDLTQTIIGHDRVHVSKLGYFSMAYQFLKTLPGMKEVSHIIIDAKLNKLKQQLNCSIPDLKSNARDVSFTYISRSLPFPTPDGLNTDSLFSFTDELNAEIVQIKGLAPGNYQLLIDSVIVGVFSNKIFAKGINLSKMNNTPQYQQAMQVLSLFNDYWDIERTLRIMKYVEFSHLRSIQNKDDMEWVKKAFDEIMERSRTDDNYSFFKNVFKIYLDNKPQEKALMSKLESLLTAIQHINTPLEHEYKIQQAID
ncbi:MAG: GDSL-type esterase/lipase family protein [Ginsengibacter sp.]